MSVLSCIPYAVFVGVVSGCDMLHCCSHHGDYLRRTPDSCSIKNFFNLLGAGSCEAALPLLFFFSPLSRCAAGWTRAPSRNGCNVGQRSVFPGCCIARMQAKEMFSLLVQYNKLVSVLTGAPPAPPSLSYNSHISWQVSAGI